MIGGFLGDLAAWTWINERDKFYPQLISDVAERCAYSDVMLLTATTIIDTPTITRDEFMRIHQCCFGLGNANINAEYDVLRSIVIGWLFDEEKIPNAIRTFCLCDDKEELYASKFMALLLCKLRHGVTKKEAAQVKFCGSFREFTQQKHWKTGKGVLGYLVRAWMSFYDAFDFGSTIHNAVKQPGDIHLNCILAGALADAMYGCNNYFVKEQYNGGGSFRCLSYVDERLYQINIKGRKFFAKNNALTNVDKHIWSDAKCPFSDEIIDEELHRRILVAFHTGWDDRYGFYLDDGWIYVYRSYRLIARFLLNPCLDGTYRIRGYQISEFSVQSELADEALRNALYSVKYRWNLVSS